MREIFAERLAEIRRNAHVSQKNAAAALGVSQALLSHYENGIREPGLDFVVRAAEYYGVAVDELLGRPLYQRQRFGIVNTGEHRPNEFVLHLERDIKDTIDVLFNCVNSIYDAEMMGWVLMYLGDVLYEIVRHLSQLTENPAEFDFVLPDKSFDSGAVVTDLTWVRHQMILTVQKLKENAMELPEVDVSVLQDRFGYALTASRELIRLIGTHAMNQYLTGHTKPDEILSHIREAEMETQEEKK